MNDSFFCGKELGVLVMTNVHIDVVCSSGRDSGRLSHNKYPLFRHRADILAMSSGATIEQKTLAVSRCMSSSTVGRKAVPLVSRCFFFVCSLFSRTVQSSL